MPVIYETDEDKYHDKEDIKKFKKGNQTGIESKGSGIFIPGTKQGFGLYLPTREGDGIIDSIISVGKSVIEGLANNSSTIGQAASAVGSIAGATSEVANAIKSIKKVNENTTDERKQELERIKKKMEQAELRGKGFKIT